MNYFIIFKYLLIIHQIFQVYSYTSILKSHSKIVNNVFQLKMARRGIEVKPTAPTFIVGENLPDEVKNCNAIYDMILVERFSQPEKTAVGLILPKIDGKDEKHLGKVISLPSDYGLEGENGRVAPVSEIMPYKLGDVVYIRDPWGIGPKDIEVGARCFSFHKAIQITGVVSSASSSE